MAGALHSGNIQIWAVGSSKLKVMMAEHLIKGALFQMILLISTSQSFCQNDSLRITHKHSFAKQFILPVSLITAGSLISGSAFEKSMNKDIRNAAGKEFHTSADDYLRLAPIVELYAADAFGVKAKNHWFDQTKNLVISIMVTDLITGQLKNITQKKRPNGGDVAHSFPSAHSSLAFTNATVMYEEFKGSSPLLAYSGYGFATTTSALRLMNNAHWLSDVMVGVGIGILVTKVVYLLDPLIKWNPFKKTNGIIVIPQVQQRVYGFNFTKRF